jgi:O-antigen/teichoic acid export membrane protein
MTGSDFRQVALSGARWTLAAKIGLQLFTWPVTIVVIRLLEPGDYGLLAMAMVIIGFVSLFSEMGLGIALVQADKLDDAAARAACAAILACNLLMAMALSALAPFAALWYAEPDLVDVMRMLTLELLISALAAVPQAQLERQLRFRQLSVASISAGIAGASTTLVLALLGLGVWSLVFGNLTLALVRTTLVVFFNGRLVWPSLRQGFAPVRGLARFGGHVLAARVLWYWYGQADQIILARLLHASILGYYNVAAQLAMLPANKAMEIINRVTFPILSRMHSTQGSLRAMHARLLALLATYAFGVCWGLAAVAPELVSTLLGDKWLPATLPLTLLAAVAPLRMLSALNNTVTSASGTPQASTLELAVAGSLIPIAVLTGARLNGLYGACLAWPLTYPFVYLVSNALTCKAVGGKKRHALLPLAFPMIAATAMWLSIWALRWQLSGAISAGALLVLELVAGSITYIVAFHVLAPALARDARALAMDLLRPGRIAGHQSPDQAGAPSR